MVMDDHINHFLRFMSVEKSASANTIAAYRNDLQQFRDFATRVVTNRNHPPWNHLETDHIVSFILELKAKNYAEATVARKVAAVRSFFQFLQAEGTVTTNPTESLESPRVGKSLPKPLSVAEVDELLEQPAKRNTPEAKRDRAMLQLLYATGMRVTELMSLDLDCLNLDSRTPHVRCMGKGSKERSIPIYDAATQSLVEYLNDGRPALVKNRDEHALFVNRRGERLTRQGFWLILKQYAREANISEPVTPHTLRHSFATHMLRGGVPLRNVQELLGHANISTTHVYTRITDEHVRRVYEKTHPRAR
jgi:integrase/recombinase XerD